MTVEETPPPVAGWPVDAFARCVICHRFIKVGRPYRMVEPGKFAHRGPCLVIRGEKE